MKRVLIALAAFLLCAVPAWMDAHASPGKKDDVVPLAPMPAPAVAPAVVPAVVPTGAPTAVPAVVPTGAPTAVPAVVPTGAPTAVTPAAPAVPDTTNILFMQNLRKIGATIYYLGDTMGLNGWFVVKDGQVQILYTTPDQKALLVGALLSAEGANVSQQQVMVLANNNPEIAKIIKGSAAATGQPPVTNVKPDSVAKVAPTYEPSVSPSEKFFQALNKAANLTFGRDTAPQIMMIMDVNCPHCHRAWNVMQPLVDAGKLRVTMVPIAALGPQSQVEAANWLAKKDPYDAWKKHIAGDDKILKTGTQEPEKEAAIFDNTKLIKNWGVDQTPYILYHGKNGKVRLVMGEPKSMDDIMGDIQ
jgi:thiol:disulfide interchange protein DsbG